MLATAWFVESVETVGDWLFAVISESQAGRGLRPESHTGTGIASGRLMPVSECSGLLLRVRRAYLGLGLGAWVSG